MNSLVAKIIGDLPISPVDSVWFDVTDESITKVYSNWIDEHGTFAVTDPIEKIPLPFDRIGIVIPLDMTGVTKNHFNDIVPYPVTVTRTGNRISMKTFYMGFKTHVNDIIFENDFESGLFKVEINPEYRKKFGHIPGFFDKKNYIDIVKAVMNVMVLLSYGIPNKGAEVKAFKPVDQSGNEKRLRKGKTQLFEWRTVLISNKVETQRVDLGGTHASPKPHDRRGHQRVYKKSGRVVYVKPTTINRHKIATDGFIHHDYKVMEKKNPSWFQSIINGLKGLFKEKAYERLSKT